MADGEGKGELSFAEDTFRGIPRSGSAPRTEAPSDPPVDEEAGRVPMDVPGVKEPRRGSLLWWVLLLIVLLAGLGACWWLCNKSCKVATAPVAQQTAPVASASKSDAEAEKIAKLQEELAKEKAKTAKAEADLARAKAEAKVLVAAEAAARLKSSNLAMTGTKERGCVDPAKDVFVGNPSSNRSVSGDWSERKAVDDYHELSKPVMEVDHSGSRRVSGDNYHELSKPVMEVER